MAATQRLHHKPGNFTPDTSFAISKLGSSRRVIPGAMSPIFVQAVGGSPDVHFTSILAI
jgi:hypothetical protein